MFPSIPDPAPICGAPTAKGALRQRIVELCRQLAKTPVKRRGFRIFLYETDAGRLPATYHMDAVLLESHGCLTWEPIEGTWEHTVQAVLTGKGREYAA